MFSTADNGPGPPAARAVELTKTYGAGDVAIRALDRVNVEFERGRFTAVMGPSGSGKSTLMHCMAGLDAPTSGSTFVGDDEIGREWFDYLVGRLGIANRLSHRPSELSGGQQQRVACARALIGRPELIFADEPTGNLDSNASAEVLEFLRRSVSEDGQSIVMVTHDAHAAAYADRVVFLADGRLVGELASPTVNTVLERMKELGS
jgi:putative ABC transport system ATP-binding protein